MKNMQKKVELKFCDLLSDCDLRDTWRLFHPENKEYTWCKKNPFVATRLDYILTNSMLFEKKTLNEIFTILHLRITEGVLF